MKPNWPTGEALGDTDAFLTPASTGHPQRNASLGWAHQPELLPAFSCCHLHLFLFSPYQGAALKNRTVARAIECFTQQTHLTKFEVKAL